MRRRKTVEKFPGKSSGHRARSQFHPTWQGLEESIIRGTGGAPGVKPFPAESTLNSKREFQHEKNMTGLRVRCFDRYAYLKCEPARLLRRKLK